MLTLPHSIFCQIIKGNIPSMKVAETPLSYAFLDLHPVAPKHSLVVSRQHGVKLHDLDDEHLADLLPLVKKVAQATGAEEYNVMQNNGRGAYQTVDHVHCELMFETTERLRLTSCQQSMSYRSQTRPKVSSWAGRTGQ
jgi:diadenosine tetraphosphate (Ap4A) HIT family hydrolase